MANEVNMGFGYMREAYPWKARQRAQRADISQMNSLGAMGGEQQQATQGLLGLAGRYQQASPYLGQMRSSLTDVSAMANMAGVDAASQYGQARDVAEREAARRGQALSPAEITRLAIAGASGKAGAINRMRQRATQQRFNELGHIEQMSQRRDVMPMQAYSRAAIAGRGLDYTRTAQADRYGDQAHGAGQYWGENYPNPNQPPFQRNRQAAPGLGIPGRTQQPARQKGTSPDGGIQSRGAATRQSAPQPNRDGWNGTVESTGQRRPMPPSPPAETNQSPMEQYGNARAKLSDKGRRKERGLPYADPTADREARRAELRSRYSAAKQRQWSGDNSGESPEDVLRDANGTDAYMVKYQFDRDHQPGWEHRARVRNLERLDSEMNADEERQELAYDLQYGDDIEIDI